MPLWTDSPASVVNQEEGVKFYSFKLLENVLAVGLRRGARGPLYRKPSIGRAEG